MSAFPWNRFGQLVKDLPTKGAAAPQTQTPEEKLAIITRNLQARVTSHCIEVVEI